VSDAQVLAAGFAPARRPSQLPQLDSAKTRPLTVPSSCACDVPSHNYTWSFEPKLDWSAVYASSKEIFAYFNDFARKYGLHKFVKTRHQVAGAAWNKAKGGYDVQIKDLESGQIVNDHCDILVNASGILNNWQWPAIPGIDKYKGTLLHTANWDDNVDLTGRHVGLIGNG
jgi:cation diffusion facilitator CzcD-associated flavoprotein CzcO